MSWLCDTTELVPSGWLTSLYAGAGVLAENIPSSGVDGPSALYGAVCNSIGIKCELEII